MKPLLILAAALALIWVALFIGLRTVRATRIWPAALLIVTAPLEVYRSSSSVGLNLSLFRLALAVAVVALFIDALQGRRRITSRLPIPFAIYAALLVWQIASLAFITPAHSLAYRFLGQYAGGLVAAFVLTCYVTRKDLRVLAATYAAGSVLPLIAAAYRVFSVSHGGQGNLPGLSYLPLDPTIEAARQSGSFLLDGTQRLNATFSDPNHFGFYMATVFLVSSGAACAALISKRPVVRATVASYALLALAAAVAIVGTYSRSSWLLAGFGGVLLMGLLGSGFWNRRRAIVICLVGTAALGLASSLILPRLGSSEPGNAVSTQAHEHTMRLALTLLAHHPITGVGLGDYGRHAGQPPLVSSAHSTFLTVAAELGVAGVALLLAAIMTSSFFAVRSTRRAPWSERALLAGFVSAFVGLAVANMIYEVWMDDFQWVLFGIVLAVTTQPVLELAGSSWLGARQRGRPRSLAAKPESAL